MNDAKNMRDFKLKTLVTIVLSFILAFTLMMLPLPQWLAWINPDWVILVFLYWAMIIPTLFGMVLFFIVGLFLDGFYNLPLGTYGIILISIYYLVNKFYVRINLFPIWQKLLLVFSFIVASRIYIYTSLWLFCGVDNFGMFLLSSFVSILIWPSLAMLLRKLS